MVFNATLNNISVISWHVSFIGGGNQRKQPTCRKSLTNFISHSCIKYTLSWAGCKLTLVVISTYCTGSCKSNYHVITTMMVPIYIYNTVSHVSSYFYKRSIIFKPNFRNQTYGCIAIGDLIMMQDQRVKSLLQKWPQFSLLEFHGKLVMSFFKIHLWTLLIWVSDCCLMPTQQFFQLYHGKNKLSFNEMMMKSALY